MGLTDFSSSISHSAYEITESCTRTDRHSTISVDSNGIEKLQVDRDSVLDDAKCWGVPVAPTLSQPSQVVA